LLGGNNELCTIDQPRPDPWVVSLRATAAYAGVSLTVVAITP
jgi:hypothetical protein